MSSQEEFVTLLKRTLAGENNTRRDAEMQLSAISREPKIGLLLGTLSSSADVEVLELAALMLRQSIEVHRTISQFSPECLAAVKQTVPQLALSQQTASVRNKLVDVAAAIFNAAPWPELTTFFYDCLVRANVDAGRLIGFRLIRSAPGVVKSLSDENLREVFRVIVESMSQLSGMI